MSSTMSRSQKIAVAAVGLLVVAAAAIALLTPSRVEVTKVRRTLRADGSQAVDEEVVFSQSIGLLKTLQDSLPFNSVATVNYPGDKEADENASTNGANSLPTVGADSASNANISQLIMLGKQAWDIIKVGKPVQIHEEDKLSIIPEEATKWTDMEGWRIQSWDDFSCKFTNGFGMETATLEWAYSWYGLGAYQGKGNYIGEATVRPGTIYTAWGHTMNANGKAETPFNHGSLDHPVAAVTLWMHVQLDTIVTANEYQCTVNIVGDGSGERIQCT